MIAHFACNFIYSPPVQKHLLTPLNRLFSSGECTPLFRRFINLMFHSVPYYCFINFVSSRSYQLSKHNKMAKILSSLIGNSDSHVLNSSEFVPFISLQTLQPNHVLVSFDVIFLFINVPIDLAIDITPRRLQSDPSLQS